VEGSSCHLDPLRQWLVKDVVTCEESGWCYRTFQHWRPGKHDSVQTDASRYLPLLLCSWEYVTCLLCYACIVLWYGIYICVCVVVCVVYSLQWKIISSVLVDGRDNCVVMATGWLAQCCSYVHDLYMSLDCGQQCWKYARLCAVYKLLCLCVIYWVSKSRLQTLCHMVLSLKKMCFHLLMSYCHTEHLTDCSIQWVTSLFGLVHGWAFWLSLNPG